MSEVKIRTTYRWKGMNFERPEQVVDKIHLRLEQILKDFTPYRACATEGRNELHQLLIKKRQEIIDLLSTEIDLEPDEFQGNLKSIFDL